MDYYEELGLDRTATEEDIKRAHRRLAKLLHPDQQTDVAVKQVAEAQMRRLNGIVDVLSTPELRRDYDEQLIASVPGLSWLKLRTRAFHSWRWWVASTVGAVVLTVGAVWFFANRWGSSFGAHAPTYISSGAEASAGSAPGETAPLAAPVVPIVSSVPVARKQGKAVTVVVGEKSARLPERSKTTVVIGSLDTPSNEFLEGEWVYAPTKPEKSTAAFYPPEFINLKIWNESGLHGEYHARYHVVDKLIPPEVNFALAPDGTPRHFTWVSSNGSKGTLRVSAMEPDSIRIEWRTTVFSRGLALTAGAATLVRRATQSN